MLTIERRPLKVFLCHAHIIPLSDADRDPVRGLSEQGLPDQRQGVLL